MSRATLQPHRVKEWMNRKHDPQFDERAHKVKELLTQATSKDRDLTHVVLSFDEKTGMQAKERIAAGQLMSAGQVERMEFEYARHGVRLLFGTLEVSTGKVSAVMSERRTSEDTARVLEQELGLRVRQGARRVTLILDQLNTHMSLEVVEVVARLSGVPLPDSKELQTMKQRKEWLEKEDRKVVFCFTPKHASWLNPIEIWFGVLVGKVLRRGSFESTKDLDAKVLAFVDYFNQKLAHPFHFKGWKSRQKAA